MNYTFHLLQSYASFLLKHHLDPLTKEAIQKAREAHLQVLKSFDHCSEEEFFELSKKRLTEDVLIPLATESPFSTIKSNIQAWKDNALVTSRHLLHIGDITGIHNIVKRAFINFIKYYNTPKDIFKLIEEIEIFFETRIDLSLEAYEDIHKKDLISKGDILSGILKNIPVIVTRLDKEGMITYSSGAGLHALGLNDRDLIGKSVFDDYPNAENTKKALKGIPVSFVGTAKSSNGSFREFQTFYIPENNGALGFSIDVTSQKAAEGQLVNLIEGVKDYAIFMLNPDGTVASWNEGARTFKGYEKQEILGRPFSVFYPKQKQDERFPDFELEQAIKTGRFEDEGIRVRKDGSTFWANVLITPIYNQEKKLLGFTKITRDLTERKRAEEILRLSEERYRLLIEAVKDYAIFLVSPEGIISSWNEGAKRLKGYSDVEIIGKHISVFYTKDMQDRKYPDYELEQARLHGRFEDEGFRVRSDGTLFYANVIFTALYDSHNTFLGFSKVTHDLTERRRYEEGLLNMNLELEEKVKNRTEELTQTVKELTKINNDLDNFIYTASHDLKAPVSNIEGLITGLFDEIGDLSGNNESLNTFHQLITSSIKRFQSTIKDLTEIAKVQKDGREENEKVDLKEVMQDTQLTIHNLIKNNCAEIIYDFSELPQITFVRKHLNSIFYNIISNGIKYRSADRIPVVRVRSFLSGGFAVISFADNGLGIKIQNMDKVFTMFKRFHDHVEGSGVGLYIVKRIIDNLGGKIELESKEGEGTTFKVFLPENREIADNRDL